MVLNALMSWFHIYCINNNYALQTEFAYQTQRDIRNSLCLQHDIVFTNQSISINCFDQQSRSSDISYKYSRTILCERWSTLLILINTDQIKHQNNKQNVIEIGYMVLNHTTVSIEWSVVIFHGIFNWQMIDIVAWISRKLSECHTAQIWSNNQAISLRLQTKTYKPMHICARFCLSLVLYQLNNEHTQNKVNHIIRN